MEFSVKIEFLTFFSKIMEVWKNVERKIWPCLNNVNERRGLILYLAPFDTKIRLKNNYLWYSAHDRLLLTRVAFSAEVRARSKRVRSVWEERAKRVRSAFKASAKRVPKHRRVRRATGEYWNLTSQKLPVRTCTARYFLKQLSEKVASWRPFRKSDSKRPVI